MNTVVEISAISEYFKIQAVEPDSIAEELSIRPGDILLTINGKKIHDYFDYLYENSNEFIELEIRQDDGDTIFEIEKDMDEDLGLVFQDPLMDAARHCHNRCLFCFIDQLPDGLREPLYFKDDDSRLSFMQGNFVTLTNMKKEDLRRIAQMGIHPINISVHTTNPELRTRMTGNPKAALILEQLEYLCSQGVSMNAQIVLVPGFNDSEELDRTLSDLSRFYPMLKAVAIVPVGITKFRQDLPKLRPFTKEEASGLIRQITDFQNTMLKRGSRFVFLADEFYLAAGEPMPQANAYEGFAHYEDGVGMIRSFQSDFSDLLRNRRPRFVDSVFICGLSFFHALHDIIETLNKSHGTTNTVVPIKNNFFGEQITVNGLLTFRDIQAQLPPGTAEVVICDNILNYDGLTLDNVHRDDFEAKLDRRVVFIGPQAEELFQ